MKSYMINLGRLLALGLFGLVIWLVYQKLQSFDIQDIFSAISQISTKMLIASFFVMMANYILMIGYDWLAIKAIRKKLAIRKVSLVSFIGCVISYNFGALLGGSAVRYRLYSAWGFSPIDIVRLVLMLAITYWIGAMGLAGILFIFIPLEIPNDIGLNFLSTRPIGFFLLLLCLLYLFICSRIGGKSVIIFKKEFSLPPLKIAIAQTFVASSELILAGLCLYLLLPSGSGIGFFEFLPNYILAQVVAVLAHIPGGVGIIELILINLLDEIPSQVVFASLLVFRVIYYLIPLFFASILLGINEVSMRRKEKNIIVVPKTESFMDWIPTLLSYIVFFIGTIYCISVLLPISAEIFQTLSNVPLWVVKFAHVAKGVLGVTLIVFAYGLSLRRKKQWYILIFSIVLLLLITIFVQGFWTFEIPMLLSVLFPLIVLRKDFSSNRPIVFSHYPMQWAIACFIVITTVTVLAFIINSFPEYSTHWVEDLMDSANSLVFIGVLMEILMCFCILTSLLLFDIKRKIIKRKLIK